MDMPYSSYLGRSITEAEAREWADRDPLGFTYDQGPDIDTWPLPVFLSMYEAVKFFDHRTYLWMEDGIPCVVQGFRYEGHTRQFYVDYFDGSDCRITRELVEDRLSFDDPDWRLKLVTLAAEYWVAASNHPNTTVGAHDDN